MALIAAAYAWEPRALRDLTDAEIAYYYEHLPRIEARAHYSTAQLNADFREMFFPRYLDPDPKGESKEPPRRRQPWQAEELLPPFAWFDDAARPQPGITREAARDFLANVSSLPAWVVEIAPFDAIKAAART